MSHFFVLLALAYLSYLDIKDKAIDNIKIVGFIVAVMLLHYSEYEVLRFERFAVVFATLYLVTMVAVNIIYAIKKYIYRIEVDEDSIGFALGEADMLIIAALAVTFKSYIIETIILLFLSLLLTLCFMAYEKFAGKNRVGGYPMVPFIMVGYLIVLAV